MPFRPRAVLVCALLAMAPAVLAADAPAPSLVVNAGRPMRIRVTGRVPMRIGEPVTAAIVDPVYVRDRLVVAAGAVVSGHVVRVRPDSRWRRLWASSGGDLTPHVDETIAFDTMVLADGTRQRIDAVAAADDDDVARGKLEWLKDYALGQLPYHRRYLHRGTTLTMSLVEPWSFGDRAAIAAPHGDAVIARLLTPVDSATATPGMPVRVALLTPLFADDGRVLASEADVLDGAVATVSRAGSFGRDGRVALTVGPARVSARRTEPNVRFIWPPLSLLAVRGARDPAPAGGANVFGRGGAGWSGFELIGAAIGQASAPVAIGFGVWGIARATYVNVLAKGRDVALPAGSIVVLSTAAGAAW